MKEKMGSIRRSGSLHGTMPLINLTLLVECSLSSADIGIHYAPTHLPPVGILLVDNVKDVSLREGKARLFTGNQVV